MHNKLSDSRIVNIKNTQYLIESGDRFVIMNKFDGPDVINISEVKLRRGKFYVTFTDSNMTFNLTLESFAQNLSKHHFRFNTTTEKKLRFNQLLKFTNSLQRYRGAMA